jgi:hypothetical protein
LPKNFKKLCEILANEKSQKVSSNGTVGNCSKVPLSNRVDKLSPTKKHVQIVARKYAQITTPNKNASSPRGSAKLSSLICMELREYQQIWKLKMQKED